MKHSVVFAFGALSAFAIVAACSHPEPTPVSAPQPSAAAAGVTAPEMQAKEQTDVASQAQISIADEIKKACGIADPDAYFAFDSTKVTDQAGRVLGKLADCFIRGPLKGKTMKLVGHADPRGEAEYNMVLGQHRADSVKQFLVSQGLPSQQVQTTSRGKMDATGHDEATWAKDRRVDVLLG